MLCCPEDETEPASHAQAGAALMVNPPKQGDPSYEQHKAEEEAIIASLRRRAQMITDGFNACEGITCNYTEGAMYSFPKLQLPQKVGARHLWTARLVFFIFIFFPKK
jgi:glutamate--glyoxylate aminotransferase